MLHEGEYRGKRVYSKDVVKLFTEKNEFGHGLGWQITTMQDSAGHSMTAIGHGGFTGTFGAFVPEHGVVFVILTNRQNLGPKPNGFYNDIRMLQRGVTQALMSSLYRSQ